ncbi:MAG TPA: PhzF family phenazine biosynthesis protein [Gemmatimonadaceae bacterium]|nr:PhzF family phenazine biosynthesis protein [Gemmatimonadaceae bacterium]
MRRYRYLTADVFTDTPFGGNQLAVLPDARGLDDGAMANLAREFNFSESVFVFPPENGGTRKVRIWTPGGELPFAGHPTVGTAHVLAAIGDIDLEGDETRIVLEEGVGPVPVTIRARDGKPVFAQLSVAKLPEVGPPVPTRETLADMLSLDAKDLLGGQWAPQAISCGFPFLFVPVKDRAALKRSRLRLDQWERTLANAWASMIFLFSRDPEREGSDIRARMYGPSINVIEDPATGSACAGLGGYLAARDSRQQGTLRWVVEQGFEMGRPSIIEVEVDKDGGKVTAVRVGGSTVMMGEGTIGVP